jgi:phage shock protein E
MRRILMLAMGLGLMACSGDDTDRRGVAAQDAGARAAAVGTAPVEADPQAAATPEAAPEPSGPHESAPQAVEPAHATAGAATERRLIFVDVRTPEEWAAGRVDGAIHIPHTELAARWRELNAYRDDDIVLYCRTGRRSGIAEQILTQAGFERLQNGGGLIDLQRQGVPVVR